MVTGTDGEDVMLVVGGAFDVELSTMVAAVVDDLAVVTGTDGEDVMLVVGEVFDVELSTMVAVVIDDSI